MPTILQSFLGKALHRFGQNHPQVSIRLQELSPTEQVEALRNGAISIAFMGNPPDEVDAEFTVRCVKQVQIAALLPETHLLADQDSIDLAELATEKFIGISEATFPGRTDRIRGVCRDAGFTPNWHHFADSHTSMIALVAADQEIAIMPAEAAALPHPQVVFMPLHHPIHYARSTAIRKKDAPTTALEKLLKILLENREGSLSA